MRLSRDSPLLQGPADTSRRPESESAATADRISSKTRVDGGYVVRQGIYVNKTDYDDLAVRRLIVDRKLSPFYPGAENEDELSSTGVRSECPICFLVRVWH